MRNKKFKLCSLLIIGIFAFNFYIYNYHIKDSENVISPDENRKVVYLTFDDGPTHVITNQLLDVLKEYNVKATFFVVGKEIEDKEDILLRIYKEGHGIGLHTYSHNYKKVYSNEEIFVDEMLSTQKYIKDITGFHSNIIRFPGGSVPHLNTNFLNKLHDNNLLVYDWNIDLKDGMYPNLTSEQLVSNSKKYRGNPDRFIILMHCNFNNKNTVKALPKIIEYYKELGCDFRAINGNTKEYYYKFRK
ncbi:polysaccharide deacetylase family protein [Clostridium rectalis]|uniref:polysaccharide deacetylase family protein n=1 Tax=Clostridium rectalis TaxID=2040295 RepID=UPI000F62E687|nr:polysaccharide deacetylase family protein [Clostridium rectalis]